MINNINSYNVLLNNTPTATNKSEIDHIVDKHKEKNVEKQVPNKVSPKGLYLSSRAQKINAISHEFFNGKELKITDVKALKDRVYQLGLISKDEYAKLTNSSSKTEGKLPSSENTTISLTSFLNNLLERLKNDDKKSTKESSEHSTASKGDRGKALTALIKTLGTAKNIIANVENAKHEKNFRSTLQETSLLLKETIKAPSFEKIPLDDKVGLSKVYQTLTIIEKLSPQRLDNEKVNKYIDLSFS